MNKFNKMYRLIMESIDTDYTELFNKIKNHDDKDLLINWVEAINENGIVDDKEFTVDDMEKFAETLNQDQLDKIVELGVEILQSVEGEDVVTEDDENAGDESLEDLSDLNEDDSDDENVNDDENTNDVVTEDQELDDKIEELAKKFADVVKDGYGWIVDDDDDIMTQFINFVDPGVEEKVSWCNEHREEILKAIQEVFDAEGIDFVPLSEIDENGDRIEECRQIDEHHTPFSKFFPVMTIDGVDTGWRMGPTDFGGRKSKQMRCYLDPSHVIRRDEVIMINPKFEGQHIAVDSYYRAVAGDKELADKLLNEYGLELNLDI